jgi:hypothetical protein
MGIRDKFVCEMPKLLSGKNIKLKNLGEVFYNFS